MLTLSKPLSAGQAKQYHAEEFRSARDNYYSQGDQIVGHWHGQLAERWGLTGEVGEEQFARLADGQHPATREQLVRHQTPHKATNAHGETVTTMEHRAGWDATFSAPKSVSLTALVGGDERVREAHRESVAVALDELERYVQARLGGNRPAETTGQWVAATFEHDSARPVDGYAAPQVHTHAVIFNMTETQNGDVRALQPRELYRTQPYATAVYRSELAARLEALGYDVERGKSGQPEIVGYTPEYLDASSPRRQQIEDYLARADQRGAAAAQIAAHQTREAKRDLSPDEVLKQHRQMAEAFGHQPTRVMEAAQARAHDNQAEVTRATTARAAVTFAKERTFEREAVVDERDVLRDALTRSMGDRTLADVKAEFEQRVQAGEFVRAEQRPDAPGRAFTTPEMLDLERDTIAVMRAGQDTQRPLASVETTRAVEGDHQHLSESQREAVRQILGSRDQVVALEGVAGAGKTTTLSAVRDVAEREGYTVEGFAPTSRAAHQLAEAGIPSSTLQRHLSHADEHREQRPHLYILDESSLASTKQMNTFLHGLRADDRVLLVGDVRQHEAVEAGSPYRQLQDAGVATARLDDIVRQKDLALKGVVENLSRGDVREAVAQLEAQGRVHEIADRADRFQLIAEAYARQPERTLVVSPDNQSRTELNHVIHRVMQARGQADEPEHATRVLVPRQEITGADRQWAGRYEPGDVLRYSKGSEAHGIRAGDYARVEHVDVTNNRLTVAREHGGNITYDPRRLQGVTVYREAERALSAGDRVQFTAPDRSLNVANRELGTIETLDGSGHVRVRLDSGRTVSFSVRDHPHLDHGYAVTSHSSQGQTVDRVLVHVDSERASAELVNRRFGYVAVSRGRHDAQIYTNDRTRLPDALSREVSHRLAMTPGETQPLALARASASENRNAAETAQTRTPTSQEISFSR
jgi:conjugative relaxase-like TrwC/TraI family protein